MKIINNKPLLEVKFKPITIVTEHYQPDNLQITDNIFSQYRHISYAYSDP